MSETPFVTTAWLAERLDAPDIVVVDGSWYLPAMNRDPQAEYVAGHIPGAVRFDIDAIRDDGVPLPHMLPAPEQFSRQVGALGIGDGMKIVVYDGAGLFAAPRVWWTFKAFGAADVSILEGGFPAWVAEGRPVEDGPGPVRAKRTFSARLNHAVVADLSDIRRVLAYFLACVEAEQARDNGVDPSSSDVLILDHDGLAAASCDCYRIIQSSRDRILG